MKMQKIISIKKAGPPFEALRWIQKHDFCFVWNRETTRSLVLSGDLLYDFLDGTLTSQKYIAQLNQLVANSHHIANKTNLSFASLSFDNLPCDNSCHYCVIGKRATDHEYIPNRTLVSILIHAFPDVHNLNISGPDNIHKYSFVNDDLITKRFDSVSVNINVRNTHFINSKEKNVLLLLGGTINDFVHHVSSIPQHQSHAYIVVDNLKQEYNLLKRHLPEMPFTSLTLEPNMLSYNYNTELFHDLLTKLRKQCKYDISGFWERPIQNVNSVTRNFCNSFSGDSICLHNTGYVSVCGYVCETYYPFRTTNDLIQIVLDWEKKLLSIPMPDDCLNCNLGALCQGGCKILHKREYLKFFKKRCKLNKLFFYQWAIDHLTSINREECRTRQWT